ncbi:hypothetical protein T439DRAFT_210121 [Meredithblackwellia eburnea MCA 4105]
MTFAPPPSLPRRESRSILQSPLNEVPNPFLSAAAPVPPETYISPSSACPSFALSTAFREGSARPAPLQLRELQATTNQPPLIRRRSSITIIPTVVPPKLTCTPATPLPSPNVLKMEAMQQLAMSNEKLLGPFNFPRRRSSFASRRPPSPYPSTPCLLESPCQSCNSIDSSSVTSECEGAPSSCGLSSTVSHDCSDSGMADDEKKSNIGEQYEEDSFMSPELRCDLTQFEKFSHPGGPSTAWTALKNHQDLVQKQLTEGSNTNQEDEDDHKLTKGNLRALMHWDESSEGYAFVLRNGARLTRGTGSMGIEAEEDEKNAYLGKYDEGTAGKGKRAEELMAQGSFGAEEEEAYLTMPRKRRLSAQAKPETSTRRPTKLNPDEAVIRLSDLPIFARYLVIVHGFLQDFDPFKTDEGPNISFKSSVSCPEAIFSLLSDSLPYIWISLLTILAMQWWYGVAV